MPSFNRVTMIGHLTRDPELKQLPSGTSVASFGIACNRKYRNAGGEDREEVTFVDCAAFGKAGEVLSQYVAKGNPLFIEGRLKMDQWEDKNGGGKRSKLSIIVENFQFLGGRGSADDEGGQARQPNARRAGAPAGNARSGSPFGEEQVFDEDSIPF